MSCTSYEVLLRFGSLEPTLLLELTVELTNRSGRLCCAVESIRALLNPSTLTFLLRLWLHGYKPLLAIRRSTQLALLQIGPQVFAFRIPTPVNFRQTDRFPVFDPVLTRNSPVRSVIDYVLTGCHR